MTDFRMQTDADEQEVAEYRSLSLMAILSAALGGLSVIAAVSAYGLFFPLAAILTGIWALNSIRRSHGSMIGRRAACAGILCGVGFLGVLLGTRWYEHRLAYQQARIFADGWLQLLVENRWEAADQATLPRAKREFSSSTVRAAYAAQPKLQKQWADFVKMSPVVQAIIAGGSETKFQWIECSQQRYLKTQRAVMLVYEVMPPRQKSMRLKFWVVRDDPLFNSPATWFAKEIARM